MFDVAPTEFLLVAVVALLVIGPKDLPKAMRVVGYWVGRMRGVARQFRSGFDSMVREAELEEMEKRWAAENERIMREHRASPEGDPTSGDGVPDTASAPPASMPEIRAADHDGDATGEPVHVEQPVIRSAPGKTLPTPDSGVTS